MLVAARNAIPVEREVDLVQFFNRHFKTPPGERLTIAKHHARPAYPHTLDVSRIRLSQVTAPGAVTTGQDFLDRFQNHDAFLLDAYDCRTLFANQSEIPEEWRTKGELPGIAFMGTRWQIDGGPEGVLTLFPRFLHWTVEFRPLHKPWYYDQFAAVYQ